MAHSAPPAFRIDVSVHDALTRPPANPPPAPAPSGPGLPHPVFPLRPDLLEDPGLDSPPETRSWTWSRLARNARGWLVPYIRSRVLPGDFHPITAYLFLEYKCNIDCWYCWSFNNAVKGMTEEVARRAIDWLHDHGCRVLGLMGGEPLLRPSFAHKVVYYAAKKGFWIYIGTNGRLLRPEFADRLNDAGAAVYNIALDTWDLKPGLPKALVPVQANVEYLMRKQYGYGYMVFFNMNICGNNLPEIRQLTEYARAHRVATDYHINETPMLEQDSHFKHLHDNPTYIRPEDWRAVDELIDWLVERNKAGYQMVNSIRRLHEMKAFVRLSSGADLRQVGWWGDGRGTGAELDRIVEATPGVVRNGDGELHFTDWNCRAGQNNVIVRTDGSLAPCFPMYSARLDWGAVDGHKFDRRQLADVKKSCQKHCFSTLNHNLAYCYNDARVIKWLWRQALRGFQGGASSFED